MGRPEYHVQSNSRVAKDVARRAHMIFKTLAVISLACLLGIRPAMAQDGTDERQWDPRAFDIAFAPFAEGFERPVFLADPDDGSGRLFVVEQAGLIRIVVDGEVLEQPFLDLTGEIETSGSEQGLLSMAFDPDYAENGRFFVGYTGLNSTNVIARFEVSADDPNQADPDSERILISVEDPYRNHNGGLVMFGADGYLYAGLGDGGSGGDPEGNGQNVRVLLGKILRLDVSGDFDSDERAYRIPDDNPFVDQEGAAPEIWAYGFRNPWRFSFDRETGDLYIGDVGQGAREEISFQAAGSPGGENYGWNILEGSQCFRDSSGCDSDGTVLPIAEYGRDLGNVVTGGYVYRGESDSELIGVYIFADFGSGNVWGLGRDSGGSWQLTEPVSTDLAISSFAEDASGELYLTAFDGTIYRVVAP